MFKRLAFIYLVVALNQGIDAQEETRLLRFPAIHQDQIVFTYAGDLYTVASTGGTARRLTSHAGIEMFARFSPDGKQIAFTGQYDGNTEVYLIPSEGGIPERLTYTATLSRDDVSDRMGPNNIVMTWKHQSDEIVFRSRMKEFNSFLGKLYTVATTGDLPVELPLPRGGFCSFSEDDTKLAYNRVFREFRTWKRYRGGMADDVWIYDFATKTIENITDHPAQDIIPMWKGDKIYFLSDRDEMKRMNLYVYDLPSDRTRKLTDFQEFDIKFPSLGPQAIVFENGGQIFLFDLATETLSKVPVYIQNDLVAGRPGRVDVAKTINHYDLAPDGNRALFVARGDLFTVPLKKGSIRQLTTSSSVHDRNAVWSPDGKQIAYISDQTGEDEIYMIPQKGNGRVVQVTRKADTYKYQPKWSPDSKKILWSDKKLRLRYVDVGSKTVREVDQAEAWEFHEYDWSPDSKWIAYSKPEKEFMGKIYLYSLTRRASYPVTEGWYDSSSPRFSPDGKYCYFVSNRDFNPIYSRTEWNHAYQDMSRIYLVTLDKTTPSPFEPQSDEVTLPGKKKSEEPNGTPAKPPVVKIDRDGLGARIVGLPIDVSTYYGLSPVEGGLYYLRKGIQDDKPQLLYFDLEKQEETPLGQVDGYRLSVDHSKMLVAREKSYAIINAPKAKFEIEDYLDLTAMRTSIDRQAEWNQIFNESWRQMREFFYAPNMHGVDWEKVKQKYQPLVSHVNHRADLTYIIGEMIGELNVGHTYVGGGDMPRPERINLGLLGAELERDSKSRYYVIKKILRGQNWDESLRSPLTEIGVDVQEDDYIIAVNGQLTDQMKNIYQALVGMDGKQVQLTVNDRPSRTGSREVTTVPTADEAELYYYNWIRRNREIVDQKTEGQVGYLHIPDMGRRGLNEFVKQYYPQLRKKALIIDIRGNGGGNVSPMIIERLRREIAMITFARNTIPGPNPGGMIYGPKIALIDEFAASDGDLFAYRFRKHELGLLVGKRTWGGTVGIRSSLPFIDGGFLYKPEFSRYDVEGKEWIIEGRGVEPDVFVDNDPAKEYAGEDQQLNTAIKLILEELETKQKEIPEIPEYPVR